MKVSVVGASGYTGAQLVKYLQLHPHFNLQDCFVSQHSQDAQKALQDLHGFLPSTPRHNLRALSEEQLADVAQSNDAVFLALPHEVSHDWVALLAQHACKVFDLSGAFRLSNPQVFKQAYGFAHEHQAIQKRAVYGLSEWNGEALKQAQIVAVPGCYPTASLLALKPLIDADFLAPSCLPVINATSGVSGAGRKASLTASFCEVSLNAYGVHTHRHTPEIEEHAAHSVIFTPHLGNFKRGILATITVFIRDGIDRDAIDEVYHRAYANASLIRLKATWPKVDDVAHTPYCDLHWQFDKQKRCLVICSAIDNLLKGAATQAVQCANLAFGYDISEGLVP